MNFYGIKYWSRNKRGCTTGEPNTRTGRMSIACDIEVFHSKKKRDEWVKDDSPDNPRIAANRSLARAHCWGMDLDSFNEDIDYQSAHLIEDMDID